MNKWAKIFKMFDTNFANAHGLPNKMNKSTVNDVAKLAYFVVNDSKI